MRPGEHFPDDQAEVVFSDQAIDWLATQPDIDADAVIDDIVDLCRTPWGKHQLSNRTPTDRLAGLNTAETLTREYRIIIRSRNIDGVGLIEVICIGPRTGNRVYDLANMLLTSGKLTDGEQTDIWDLLTLLGTTSEHPGLEGWDTIPEPAPAGLVKAAVATGLIPEPLAAQLSRNELIELLHASFDPTTGTPDLERGLSVVFGKHADQALDARQYGRCGVQMIRAQLPCVRRAGHPGPHRSERSLPR